MGKSVNENEFYMWRTLFALAHADNVVRPEEVRYLAEGMEGIEFSDEQREILADDMREAKDINEMFEKMSDTKVLAKFFKHARALVHVDGEYGADEQRVMEELIRRHINKVDLDQLIGNVELELEGGNHVQGSFHDGVRGVHARKKPFWKRIFGG